MHLNQFAELGLGALSATVIVTALGLAFEYGHSLSLAALLRPLLGV